MKNICIVTTGHPPFDERIFWKFAVSLCENGYSVTILCSTLNISREENGVNIKGFDGNNITKREKINKLSENLAEYKPSVVICCEPLTILAASRYRKKNNRKCKIISDITEWYPENVALKKTGIKRILQYVFLYLFNIYTVNKADALIVGEKRKKKRYDFIAPFKKKTIISYYPVLKYFNFSLTEIDKEVILCYAGLISFERGILSMMNAVIALSEKYPELTFKLMLVGKFQKPEEEQELFEIAKGIKSFKVEYAGWTSYDRISDYLKDVHICFDLRVKNFIYNNSLPIKIFEYMASGKPYIYSDIDPVREELEHYNCGILVEPDDIENIIAAVELYINSPDFYTIQCVNARRAVVQDKNWEQESVKLISFINGL